MTNGTQYILKVDGIEDYVEVPNHKDLSLAREETLAAAQAKVIIDEARREFPEVEVTNVGSGYTEAPEVEILGDRIGMTISSPLIDTMKLQNLANGRFTDTTNLVFLS